MTTKHAQITVEDIATQCCDCPHCHAPHEGVTTRTLMTCWKCGGIFQTSESVIDHAEASRTA